MFTNEHVLLNIITSDNLHIAIYNNGYTTPSMLLLVELLSLQLAEGTMMHTDVPWSICISYLYIYSEAIIILL